MTIGNIISILAAQTVVLHSEVTEENLVITIHVKLIIWNNINYNLIVLCWWEAASTIVLL